MLHDIHNEHDANVPGSGENDTDKKLREIYAEMVRLLNTDAMLGIILRPEVTTEELVEGVKNKILTLSRN